MDRNTNLSLYLHTVCSCKTCESGEHHPALSCLPVACLGTCNVSLSASFNTLPFCFLPPDPIAFPTNQKGKVLRQQTELNREDEGETTAPKAAQDPVLQAFVVPVGLHVISVGEEARSGEYCCVPKPLGTQRPFTVCTCVYNSSSVSKIICAWGKLAYLFAFYVFLLLSFL